MAELTARLEGIDASGVGRLATVNATLIGKRNKPGRVERTAMAALSRDVVQPALSQRAANEAQALKDLVVGSQLPVPP